MLRQADDDVEAAITLKDLTRVRAAKRRAQNILHVRDVKPVARQGGTIGNDLQHWQASDLLDLHVLRARDAGHDLFDAAPCFEKRIEVITEHFDGHVSAHARQQFIEPHLDWLGELVIVAGNLLHGLLHFRDEVGARTPAVRPLAAGSEEDERVGDARRHRVSCDLCRADLRHDTLHFRKLAQSCFELRLHLDGLAEAGSWNAQGV